MSSEKKKSAPLYTIEPTCRGLSLVRVSHTRRRWPLSLSHHWSLIRPHPVRQRKGRMCIVSPFDGTEAARPDLRYPPLSLIQRGRADATCSLPQYGQIPPAATHLVASRRPPLLPCCTARLPTSLHVENLACGSNIVLCPKHSSSGVLSILQSLSSHRFRQTQPGCYLPLGQGICFFFVIACVINCYWPVIVSFLPIFCKQGYPFHLVAIATFW